MMSILFLSHPHPLKAKLYLLKKKSTSQPKKGLDVLLLVHCQCGTLNEVNL